MPTETLIKAVDQLTGDALCGNCELKIRAVDPSMYLQGGDVPAAVEEQAGGSWVSGAGL